MTAAFFLLRIGNWRYLIAGVPLAFLLYAVCRLVSALTAPFAAWRRFRGICIAADGDTVLAEFTDQNRLTHTAAFRQPERSRVQSGEPVRFAVRTEAFCAGSYPKTAAELAENPDVILCEAAYRRALLHILIKKGICGAAVCGAALAAFLIAVKTVFPAH